ncbi:MAG: hypothetical protein L0387_38980 [Acidobacteria bacterium]|nr:hypothetical protein [Acidobacteriota bacterium]
METFAPAPALDSTLRTKMFCGVCPLKDGVDVYFHAGAELPHPERLLDGSGKGMRTVKLNAEKSLRPRRS